ncbi:SPOCS domain-containing protein, partial [Clostridium chrysemydis]|uniref:SPOCS domain-containing protein n=1 Tax=Clostridium chrysemydis TaxID=2665504 RepID=UPI003F2DFA0A
RIDLNSNSVLTNNKNNLSKDFLLFSKVETRCSISKISNIKSEITVIESKFINSFIKNKVKVLVLGKIKYKIFYKSYNNMRYLEKTIGFSESMLLPIEASYLDKIQIKIKSKDLVLNIKENKKIFISNNLVLYY